MPEFYAGLLAEIIGNVGKYVGFGGGGKAAYRCGAAVFPAVFGDEFDRIQVIGSEIVPPFGQAVRLIEYPAVDLTLGNGGNETVVAELFGGNQQDADVAQCGFVQYFGAFDHFDQSVEHSGAGNVFSEHSVQLVFHQRLQGRNDDGQPAVTVIAVECGNLITQGFSAARGQDRQRVQTFHPRLHNGALPAFETFEIAK